jgi:cyclopropane fatty-acyl-phospholipid synthase-like methyltransferase
MANKVIDKTFNSLWNENHRKHNKSEIQYDDWLVKWLPQLKSGANILELGCGLGNNAKFLADNG